MNPSRMKFTDGECGVYDVAPWATGVRLGESDRDLVAALFPSVAALESRPVQRVEPTSAEPLDGCRWRAWRGAVNQELDFRVTGRAPARRWPATSSGNEAFQPFGPNQTLEPTPPAVTICACAQLAPAVVAAHL